MKFGVSRLPIYLIDSDRTLKVIFFFLFSFSLLFGLLFNTLLLRSFLSFLFNLLSLRLSLRPSPLLLLLSPLLLDPRVHLHCRSSP